MMVTRKKIVWTLVFICFGTLALWWGLEWREKSRLGGRDWSTEGPHGDGTDEEDPDDEDSGETAGLSRVPRFDEEGLSRQVPGLEAVEEDSLEDSQATPLRIVQFAESLAPKMEQALESEAKAQDFFQELSECAKNPGEAENYTIRAICLANAARLAETFPSRLEQRFEGLLREMPEKIQLLVKSFLQ